MQLRARIFSGMPRGAIMSLSRPRATRTLTAHRRWLSSGSTPLGTADNMQSFPASASSAVPPTAPPQTLSLDATAPPDHWRIAAVPTHTFDTMQFIQRLEQAGFTRTQSETILSSLQEVIDASMEDLQRTMVSRAHQDKTVHSYRLDFAHLKSDIQLLEKNDFALLKQENERIAGEVEKLKSKMREDLQRFQAGVRLDMNLDKGRVRDEQSVLQLQIKEAGAKLEQESGQLRSSIENVRMDTIKTIGAAATSIGLLILGWARFLKS